MRRDEEEVHQLGSWPHTPVGLRKGGATVRSGAWKVGGAKALGVGLEDRVGVEPI